MKTTALILASFIILFPFMAFASGASPQPFFTHPTFFDVNDDDSYSSQYRMISSYFGKESEKPVNSDMAYRTESEKTEPENYKKYISGAESFNKQDYQQSIAIFSELKAKAPPHSWTKEAASYMLARSYLVMSQKNWDGFSDPIPTGGQDKANAVDQNILNSAKEAYKQYLADYPNGLYAESARNINRKILYLSGDTNGLNQQLKNLMLKDFPVTGERNETDKTDTILEFTNHFNGQIDVSSDSPILIAYAWLGTKVPAADDIAILEKRKTDFNNYHLLFEFTKSLGLYKLGKYDELIDFTKEIPISKDPFSLSIAILEARALTDLNKPDAAIEILEKMHAASPEDAVEKEIGIVKINQHDAGWLLSDKSPVTAEKNLRAFAQFGMNSNELETAIKAGDIKGDKRRFAVDELVRRYLLLKEYKKLNALMQKEKYSKIFSPLRPIAQKLAKSPHNPSALAEAGYFIYETSISPMRTFDSENFAGYYESWNTESAFFVLLDAKKQDDSYYQSRIRAITAMEKLKNNYMTAFDYFMEAEKIIKKSNVRSEKEAKLLHYLVKCGKDGEFMGRCTANNKNIKIDGKSLFLRLHKLYPDSGWTAKTPYYY